jgi:hypothetical protein
VISVDCVAYCSVPPVCLIQAIGSAAMRLVHIGSVQIR